MLWSFSHRWRKLRLGKDKSRAHGGGSPGVNSGRFVLLILNLSVSSPYPQLQVRSGQPWTSSLHPNSRLLVSQPRPWRPAPASIDSALSHHFSHTLRLSFRSRCRFSPSKPPSSPFPSPRREHSLHSECDWRPPPYPVSLLETPARPLSAFLFLAVPPRSSSQFCSPVALGTWWRLLCSLVARALSSPSSSFPDNAPLSQHKGNTVCHLGSLFPPAVSPLQLTQNPWLLTLHVSRCVEAFPHTKQFTSCLFYSSAQQSTLS